MTVTGNHQKILAAIFADPVRSNIAWAEVEWLLVACDAEMSGGRGHGPGLP